MAQAVLSAVFRGVDEISDKFERMTSSGVQAVDSFSNAGTMISDSMEQTASGADIASRSIDNAATSTERLTSTMGSVSDGADRNAASMGRLGESVDETSQEFDALGDEAGNAEIDVSDSINAMGAAIMAAGVAMLIRQITAAVIDLANEFSRAEAIIVKSSGATGQELASLRDSTISVWSGVPESIENVATVLGTLNTATGAVGDEIEELTRKTLDFARVNNEDAAVSASTLGRLKNALELDVAGLSATLDQLTLASQMSGLGVNAMAEYIIAAGPSFEEMGFGVERSIALFSSFYQAGAEPRELLSSLNILLNRMAQEGLTNAEEAFDELIASIYAAPDILSATVIASEAFGARVGAKVADDIRAGRFAIDDWVDAISNSQGTLAATAEAALTVEERWEQASNSLSAAFVGQLAPATNAVSLAFADMVEGIGNFLQENPALASAIAALGVTLGAAAAGIMAFVAAGMIKMKVLPLLTAGVAMFGITTQIAIWPLTLIVGAIAAVVAIITVLASRTNQAEDEMRLLSAASREQYMEIQALESRYEETVATLGETSTEAQLLRVEIDALTDSFERNRISMEDFMANHRATMDGYYEMVQQHIESREAVEAEAESIMSLVDSLEALMGQTSRTAAEKQQILGIVDLLNQRIPELGLVYDAYTDSLNLCAAAIRAIGEAEVQRRMHADMYDAMLERIERQVDLDTAAAAALEQKGAAQREFNAAEQAWLDAINADFADHFEIGRLVDEMFEAQKNLETLTEAWEEAALVYERNSGWIDYYARNLANYSAELERAAQEQEELTRQIEEAEIAVTEIMDRITELGRTYDAAYAAAYSSISGQFNLWDVAKQEITKSIDEITMAMDSQIEHWEAYRQNIDIVNAAADGFEGLSDVVADFGDGSQMSVAVMDDLATKVEAAGTGCEESAQAVRDFITTWENLQEEQAATAASLADLQTNYTNTMNELTNELTNMVNGMDVAGEARSAAEATMNAYLDALRAGGEEAVAEANRIGAAVAAALGSGTVGGGGGATPRYPASDGLAYVPYDEFPANLHKGERVLTAEENIRYNWSLPFIEALSRLDSDTSGSSTSISAAPPMNISMSSGSESSAQPTAGAKEHVIRLEGVGTIKCDSAASKEAVLDLLQANMKPVLLGIIQEEIFEEGELSYDF